MVSGVNYIYINVIHISVTVTETAIEIEIGTGEEIEVEAEIVTEMIGEEVVVVEEEDVIQRIVNQVEA